MLLFPDRRPQIRAIIFDLDGLLLDTEALYRKVDTDAYARYGGIVTDELCQQALGLTHEDKDRLWVEALQLSIPPEVLSELRAQMLAEVFPLAELMAGADALVAKLATAGAPMAIASSATAAAIQLKLQRHPEIRSAMSSVVASDHPNVRRPKPAPDLFLTAALELGIAPGSCLVLEDAPSGVEAALAADMNVVAIPDPNLPEHPIFARAHQVLPSLIAFDPALWGLLGDQHRGAE